MSDLNLSNLGTWLEATLPGAGQLRSAEKFAGGQSNPTYRLDATGGQFVLRRKPFGPLLPSAHAVDREFRLISALKPAGYPAAAPLALCTDEGVIGSMFYIMELVEGRNYTDATLPDLPAQARRAYFEALVVAQARLHSLDVKSLGLDDFGAPGNYLARQVQRWTKQYRAAQTDDVPEVERLIDWLPSTIPEQGRTAIIHGDYRIDNVIYDPELPSIRAVLDWELATIGDPLADFAYLAMHWIMPRDGRSGLAGCDLDAIGLPTLPDIIADYCAATGRDGLPDLHWYFAFNLFRLVGIVQGIKKRLADGNASSARAAASANRLLPLAALAWEEARKAGAPA